MSDLRNGSMDADKEREDGVHMNMNTKIEELLAVLKKKEDDKQKNTVLWVLAIIGAVAAVAGIAFAVSSLRIIWRILKKISMMILTIILRMRKNKNRQPRLIPGLFSCRSVGQKTCHT